QSASAVASPCAWPGYCRQACFFRSYGSEGFSQRRTLANSAQHSRECPVCNAYLCVVRRSFDVGVRSEVRRFCPGVTFLDSGVYGCCSRSATGVDDLRKTKCKNLFDRHNCLRNFDGGCDLSVGPWLGCYGSRCRQSDWLLAPPDRCQFCRLAKPETIFVSVAAACRSGAGT